MKNNVTLVLSGGGARGIAHIGVIEEIVSQGYKIKSIAGTSMGALVGGIYAVGKLEEFKTWILSLDKHAILKMIDFSFSSQGLIKGDKVFNAMKQFIPDALIENMAVKFTATAFDLANNKEVVFSQGNLFHAIRSSISIPTVFTPVVSGKSVLVDGGLANNVPISNAVRTANDLLFVVNVNADIPAEKPPITSIVISKRREYLQKLGVLRKGYLKTESRETNDKFTYFKLISKTISSMINNVSVMMIKNYNPDVLIEISRKSCGTYDFFKAEEQIETGRIAARRALNFYK